MIEPSLLAAYVAAGYRVDTVPPFVMRVGQPCPPLVALLRHHHCNAAAYLTAWNPGSTKLPMEQNIAAQARLVQEVAASGHRWYDGTSNDPAGEWPQEPSVLVLGISRERARELARSYGQNAFLWCALETNSELSPALVVV